MKIVFVVPVFTSNALAYPFCKYRRRQLRTRLKIRITKLAARKSLLEWGLRSKQEIGPNTSIACEMGQR
jgi:hypothetical protein